MSHNLIDDDYCFICGKGNPEGLSLSFHETLNGVSAEFILRREYQGYKGIIHGGLIVAILDEAMVKAANLRGFNAITAEIIVRFKKPLSAGQKARVKGRVIKESRRLIVAQAVIDRGDVIIAEAEGKLYVSVV